MCLSSLGAFDRAAVLFTASLCLDARSVKSTYQLGKALLELECVEDAFTLCSAAKEAFPDDPASMLGKLMDKIELARSAKALKPSDTAQPGPATDQKNYIGGERYRAEKKKNSEMDLGECKRANEMMQLLSLMAPEAIKNLGMDAFPPPPPMHLELANARTLPRGCDVDRCLATMEKAVENAKGLCSWLVRILHSDKPMSEETLFKRFGVMILNPIFQEWISSPRRTMGDVSFDRLTGCLDESHYTDIKYDNMIQQQFSNASNRPEKMFAGKTHVAVGFVDLGSLIWSDIVGGAGDQPMGWVGYEASAFCVAKTMVLSEMLRDGSQIEAIFHVWFSSVWPSTTLAAFLRALKTVIDGAPRLSSEVLSYLSHWSMHTTVSAAAAYRGWLETQTDSTMFPANFKRLQDRVALCRYITTGDLLGATRTGDVVGSIVMFANPPGSGAMSLNSNFLHTVYFPLLAKEWKRPGMGDVVQAAVGLTLARIAQCASLARSGKLVTRVLHKVVDVKYPAVLREVSALKPYTMSWSNVPDYYHPKTFFDLAQQCSAPLDAYNEDATVHGFYSMNWIQSTYGAHVLDIKKKEMCKELFDQGNEVYAAGMKAMGAFQWMVLPEVSHPLCRTDTVFFVIFCFDKMTRFDKSGERGADEE